MEEIAQDLWVETGCVDEIYGLTPGEAIASTPPGLWHALFAVRINPRSFEERKLRNWGFNAGSLMNEALDRQRLFIESQHPADNPDQGEPEEHRTLALRCRRDPARPGLDLTLVGKVCALDEEAARLAAYRYWQELCAMFPYDYQLAPVTERQNLLALSGWRILDEGEAASHAARHKMERNDPTRLIEIRRFEGVLSSGDDLIWLLGKWLAMVRADEQIWRAMACCPVPLLFSVTLRPTMMRDVECFALAETITAVSKAMDTKYPTVCRDARWAADLYNQRMASLRYPYLVQLHLVAPDGVPAYLLRSIGSALTHPGRDGLYLPGYQAVSAFDTQRLEQSWKALRWLEFTSLTAPPRDTRLNRMRYMMDAREALAAFCLPYPPEGDIPGVTFN